MPLPGRRRRLLELDISKSRRYAGESRSSESCDQMAAARTFSKFGGLFGSLTLCVRILVFPASQKSKARASAWGRLGCGAMLKDPERHHRRGAATNGARLSETQLVAMCRAGDELAFMELVGRHHAAMVRLARSYVYSESVAEDVVQETWLAALRALPSFQGRSSLKTWLYRILVNRARTAGLDERRQIPVEDPERAGNPPRRHRDGMWCYPPAQWVDDVEDRVRAERLRKSIGVAIGQLPTSQRDVLRLRSVEGLGAADASEALGLGQGHQRVLLHRARSRLRNALEAEFKEVAR